MRLYFQFIKCDACSSFKWLDELNSSSAASADGGRSNGSFKSGGNSFGARGGFRGGAGGKNRGSSGR